MQKYHEIQSQQELEEVLELVFGLHDCLLKEVGILSRGYVDESGDLLPAAYDIRVFCQSQWVKENVFGIEFIFKNVTEFNFIPDFDAEVSDCAFNAQIIDSETGVITSQSIIMEFGSGTRISGERVQYRLTDRNELGKGPFTIKQIEV